jgi:hypothetical protein
MDIPATARALAWIPDEARRSEAIESALRAAQAAALREAAEAAEQDASEPDETFDEWCDYDMEIEASREALRRFAARLRDRASRLAEGKG